MCFKTKCQDVLLEIDSFCIGRKGVKHAIVDFVRLLNLWYFSVRLFPFVRFPPKATRRVLYIFIMYICEFMYENIDFVDDVGHRGPRPALSVTPQCCHKTKIKFLSIDYICTYLLICFYSVNSRFGNQTGNYLMRALP